jgi:hypothetical protein
MSGAPAATTPALSVSTRNTTPSTGDLTAMLLVSPGLPVTRDTAAEPRGVQLGRVGARCELGVLDRCPPNASGLAEGLYAAEVDFRVFVRGLGRPDPRRSLLLGGSREPQLSCCL